jgi:hypothetical protein
VSFIFRAEILKSRILQHSRKNHSKTDEEPKQLIVKRYQVRLLRGTAPLDAVAVNRFDHDLLAARLANAIAVSHERSAGGSTENAGSDAFHRHRTRRVCATRMIMPIAAHAMRLLTLVSVVFFKSY